MTSEPLSLGEDNFDMSSENFIGVLFKNYPHYLIVILLALVFFGFLFFKYPI